MAFFDCPLCWRLLSTIHQVSLRKLCLYLLFYLPLLIISLFLAFWIYLSTETIPNLISIDEARELKFDYIIIGGGTAGCVLANRLSANEKIQVLLIEAGGVFSPLAMVPLLTSQQQKTQADWQLETTQQKYSSDGFLDQVQFLPRGKGLGGSSQLNYLLHFDGNEQDFERWKLNGASNWNFKKFQTVVDDVVAVGQCSFDDNANKANHEFAPADSSNLCTKKSPNRHIKLQLQTKLYTTPMTYDYSPLSAAFVDGSTDLQRKANNLDHYLVKYNTLKGLRHSTYHSYLKPAYGRKNLKILLGTRAHRVEFERKMATKVIVSVDNFKQAPQKITAKREIILSSGAFHSPQLLMLSGIGRSDELKRFKINVERDSPMVGRNLYDHVNLPLYVTVNGTMTVTRDKVLSVREFLNYALHGQGIFANFGVIGYLNAVDDYHGIGVFGVATIDERVLRKIVNYDREAFRRNFPFYHNSSQEGFVLLNTCNQPMSRGNVRLHSNHIRDPPAINPNYLENDEDINCIIRSIRLAVKLIETRSFRQINAKIHWPEFEQCKNFGPLNDDDAALSDRYLECIIRVGGVTAHHPGGTCAIGRSSASVLDSRLRVRGVKHLRVVDASILPTPVSGTPHTNVVATAEYAADLILNDFY